MRTLVIMLFLALAAAAIEQVSASTAGAFDGIIVTQDVEAEYSETISYRMDSDEPLLLGSRQDFSFSSPLPLSPLHNQPPQLRPPIA